MTYWVEFLWLWEWFWISVAQVGAEHQDVTGRNSITLAM